MLHYAGTLIELGEIRGGTTKLSSISRTLLLHSFPIPSVLPFNGTATGSLSRTYHHRRDLKTSSKFYDVKARRAVVKLDTAIQDVV